MVRRTAGILLAGAAVAGLVACGSDDEGPGVATAVSSAPPAAAATTAAPKGVQAELAAYVAAQQKWVSCLRDHGLNPPDPDRFGRVIWKDIPVKVDAAFESGQQACKPLQSAPSDDVARLANPPLTPAEAAIKRRYADCMQENGAPDFPDPGPDGEFVDRPWEQASSGAARATSACASIIGDPAKTGPGVG